MYFGENALELYLENSINNDIILVNETCSVTFIAKFIIKKLKEFWTRFLELIKIIKSKFLDIINKIKKKKQDMDVDHYKTFKYEEFEPDMFDYDKFEPDMFDYDKFSESYITEAITVVNRITKKGYKDKQIIIEKRISNAHNFSCCEMATQYLSRIYNRAINKMTGNSTITATELKTLTQDNNNDIDKINEIIGHFDEKRIDISVEKLIGIKDHYGSTYLKSSLNTTNVKDFCFLDDKVTVGVYKISTFILDKNTEKDIQNIINYFNNLKEDFIEKNINGEDIKEAFTQYINSLNEFAKIFSQINQKLFSCILEENNTDKLLEQKYLSITLPFVKDIDTANPTSSQIINKNSSKAKEEIKKEKKQRVNDFEANKYKVH